MDLMKKLKTGAAKAADVAQQTVEMTKIAAQITGRKREIEKYKTLMGDEIYEAYRAGKLSEAQEAINELCLAIEELEQEIEGLERKMKRLRNERSCVCGKTLPADVKYCPECGRPRRDVSSPEVITLDERGMEPDLGSELDPNEAPDRRY